MSSSPAPARRPALGRALLALALVVAAAGLLFHSTQPRYHSGVYATAPNAMVLPQVLLALWIALGLASLALDLRAPPASERRAYRPALLVGAGLLAMAVALPHAGFVLTVTPLVLASLVALGERRPLPLLAATVLLGPGLWYLFHHVLLIRLPSVATGGAF